MRITFIFILFSLSFTHLVYSQDTVLEEDLMGENNFDESKYIEASDEMSFEDETQSKIKEMDQDLLNEEFPDIDFKTVDTIIKNEYSNDQSKFILRNTQGESTRNFTYAEKEALKIQLKDIVESGVFYAGIRQGTQLVHIRSGKLFYAQKNLTVKAYRKNDYEGYKLLINKNGFSSYKVASSNINSIKEITNLYEPPKKYTPVKEQKTNYRILDNDLKYQTQFNFHLGLSDPKFINDLGNLTPHTGQTTRYEGAVYGNFDFLFKLGLTMQWETMSGSLSNGGKYNMYSFSMGPAYKSQPIKLGSAEYQFFAQVRLAAFSKIKIESPTQSSNYNLAQTSLVLGVEREVNTFLGKFQIGGNYQRQWLKPSAENYKASVSAENNYNDSYVLSIGKKMDWIW